MGKKIKDTENKLKIFHSPDNRGDKKHVNKIKMMNLNIQFKQLVYKYYIHQNLAKINMIKKF